MHWKSQVKKNMGLKWLKYMGLSLLLLNASTGIRAQMVFQSYLDVGENTVSNGVYVKSAFRAGYQLNRYKLVAGMQMDVMSNSPNVLTGTDIIGSRSVVVGETEVDIKGYFILNRFSDLMYEANWGLCFFARKSDHFAWGLGTNLKAYTINSEARAEYSITGAGARHFESLYLTYVFSGYLKPQSSNWNLSLSFTNVDYYLVNQATNPIFNLQAIYRLGPNLIIHCDAWYKQAGVFNISANYFGYFFRGGIILRI